MKGLSVFFSETVPVCLCVDSPVLIVPGEIDYLRCVTLVTTPAWKPDTNNALQYIHRLTHLELP